MVVDRVRLAGMLTEIVSDHSWTTESPKRLCMACAASLPVDGVGLSLMMHDQPDSRVLLGASDERGARIEELQFGLGEGPCVSAFVQGRPVLVQDLESREAIAQWPMFACEALDAGIAAVFAFPLQLGAIAIGVLDCYRSRAGPLTEVAEALVVTDAVMIAVLSAQAFDGDGSDGAPDLFDGSWRNHAVVHQATGALSVELGVSVGQSLARLRAHAFGCSRSLDAVAGDVLTGKLRLTQ
jgi:GAF domain